jgi:hypothetical protein
MEGEREGESRPWPIEYTATLMLLLLTLVHYPLSIFYLSREKLRANFAGLSLFIKLIAAGDS